MNRTCLVLVCLLPLAACGTSSGGGGGTWWADGYVYGADVGVTDTVLQDTGDPVSDGGLTGTDTAVGPSDAASAPTDAFTPPKDTAGCATCCKGNGDCADEDPCTQDKCDLGSGQCSHDKVAGCGELHQPCGPQAPCVTGVCDPATNACLGCVTSADCGPGKLCQANACKPAVTCQSDVQCKATAQVCSKADGVCVDCNTHADCADSHACIDHACVPAPTCQSSKDCAKVCDVGMGKCVQCVAGADCPSGQWCSPMRKCVPALCSGAACAGKALFLCKADGSGYDPKPACDDANPCTDNVCENGKGCAFPPNAAKCDDNNTCTVNDVCKAGSCGGEQAKCDDGNPCTNDGCKATTGCVYTASSASCDDGDVCTQGDKCSSGACKGGPKKNCDDANPCTDDLCDKVNGCQHNANGLPCDDGNKCTDKDFCLGGTCKGNASKCDDGKLCTDDGCDPSGGCKYTPNSLPCDDGNLCTENDKCSGGSCYGGSQKQCNDGDMCTADTCSTVTGCVHTNNTAYCNDGDACTSSDKCAFGVCKGNPLTCNDNNACTNDACDKAKGCQYTPHTNACDDGNKCTQGDACKAGKCEPGAQAVVCKDADACTDDTCDKIKGCTYVSNANKCNDSNVCTADSCDKTTGKCSNVAIAGCCVAHATCDDKKAETKDICAGNKCLNLVESKPCAADTDCADNDACTADTCDKASGKCAHVAKPEACDTKGLVFDFESDMQGWISDPPANNLMWSKKTIADGPKGKGALHYGVPSSATFTGVSGANYVYVRSPEIKLAAGQGWKMEMNFRFDITYGYSSYNQLYIYFENDNKSVLVSTYTGTVKGWQAKEWDVSAFAGVPFKVALRGRIGNSSSSSTSYKANGSGYYFDEIRFVSDGKLSACTSDADCDAKGSCLAGSCQAGSCQYIHKCCTQASDCDDGKTCTTDSCVSGSCKFTAAAGCCSTSAECNDGKTCTLDHCEAGKCTYPALAECCEKDADCDDGDNVCTVDTCSAGKCVYKNTCCKEDKECDDQDDKCTIDKCVGGKCAFTGTGAAGCCTPTVWIRNFDDGTSGGLTFSNSKGTGKGWQVWSAATYTKSPKGALYYGDPVAKNFSMGGSNYGTATLPAIDLPANKQATLRMWAYFATEKSGTYDKLTIYALPSGGTKTAIWAKSSTTLTSSWVDLSIPLASSYQGKKVTFSLYFTTVDSTSNSSLGVLIDDLRVEQPCP